MAVQTYLPAHTASEAGRTSRRFRTGNAGPYGCVPGRGVLLRSNDGDRRSRGGHWPSKPTSQHMLPQRRGVHPAGFGPAMPAPTTVRKSNLLAISMGFLRYISKFYRILADFVRLGRGTVFATGKNRPFWWRPPSFDQLPAICWDPATPFPVHPPQSATTGVHGWA